MPFILVFTGTHRELTLSFKEYEFEVTFASHDLGLGTTEIPVYS